MIEFRSTAMATAKKTGAVKLGQVFMQVSSGGNSNFDQTATTEDWGRSVAPHVALIHLRVMSGGDVLARILSIAAKDVVALDLLGL